MMRAWFLVILLGLSMSAAGADVAEQVARLDDATNFESVVKSGDAAVAPLTEALKGARPDLAARALGTIHSPAAVPALVNVANNPDGELRATVAWALGQCGGPDATKALLTLAKDTYAPARVAAVLGLASLQTPESNEAFAGALTDTDERIRLASLDAIRAANRTDLALRITPLLDFHIEQIPEKGADGKPKPDAKLVDQILWNEPNASVRLAAIKTLASLKVPDALPAMIGALERETSFNRLAIIASLESMGPSVPSICLGRIVPLPYDKSSFDQYMPILVNNGTLAVIAGKLGDDRCIPYLIDTLKLPPQTLGNDKDLTELFIQTIDLLGRYKVERSARALVTILRTVRVKQVSDAAQRAIQSIGHSAARPLATGMDDWQMAPIFFRLLRQPDLQTRVARDAIVKYLGHESDEVRLEATETLGLYLSEGLLDEYDMPMLEAMYLDPNAEVRAACAKWKQKISGGKDASAQR